MVGWVVEGQWDVAKQKIEFVETDVKERSVVVVEAQGGKNQNG